MNNALTTWLRTGERGISSNCIVEVMEGYPAGTITGRWLSRHPQDPSDFLRCVRLFEAVPSYRARLGEMAAVSPVWVALVAHWDELTALLESEVASGTAPRTYAWMREIITGAGGT